MFIITSYVASREMKDARVYCQSEIARVSV